VAKFPSFPSRMRQVCCGLLALAGGLSALIPSASYADPPSWAPAHGWRRQHDPDYTGYGGRKWDNDYGVVAGHCDRQAIGTVLGATVGGAVGSQIGKGNGNAVATVLGAVIGGVVGAQIGRDLDGVDRACVGHVLELAGDNQRVTWKNSASGASYQLSPTRGYQQDGHVCREFSLRMTVGGNSELGVGIACQTADGTWQIARRGDEHAREEGGRRHPGKGRERHDDD
jgi:surface antigen